MGAPIYKGYVVFVSTFGSPTPEPLFMETARCTRPQALWDGAIGVHCLSSCLGKPGVVQALGFWFGVLI